MVAEPGSIHVLTIVAAVGAIFWFLGVTVKQCIRGKKGDAAIPILNLAFLTNF